MAEFEKGPAGLGGKPYSRMGDGSPAGKPPPTTESVGATCEASLNGFAPAASDAAAEADKQPDLEADAGPKPSTTPQPLAPAAAPPPPPGCCQCCCCCPNFGTALSHRVKLLVARRSLPSRCS